MFAGRPYRFGTTFARIHTGASGQDLPITSRQVEDYLQS